VDPESNVRVVVRELDAHGQEIQPSAQDGPPEEEPVPGRGINPYLVVLWVIAAGLIVGGIAMIAKARDPLSSGPGGSLPLSYLLVTVAPFALLGGTLTCIALLFWHAVQWQKRHR
jgi:hypothetical protein